MCGRFALYAPPDEVRTAFGAADAGTFPPRYNIAPTQPIAVIHTVHGVRHFDLMRWGLVPRWVDDPRRFELLINARAETVEERPAFRDAVRYRRCLIPASGYYDWNSADREPRFIRPRDGNLIALAGLYETWSDRQFGGDFDSACIITVASDAAGASIGRMPVMVATSDFAIWLKGELREAVALLRPMAERRLAIIPVTRRVNFVENDDPTLIEQADPETGEVPFD